MIHPKVVTYRLAHLPSFSKVSCAESGSVGAGIDAEFPLQKVQRRNRISLEPAYRRFIPQWSKLKQFPNPKPGSKVCSLAKHRLSLLR